MLELRRIDSDDWQLWRQVRLAALTEAPYAFGSTLRGWTGDGDAEARWRQRLDAVPLNLVAFVDERAAGQASGTAVGSDGRVEVISMWVAPSCRGHGVGVALLDAIGAWARDQGASAVALAVKQTNEHAIRLYQRAGFRRTTEPADDPDEKVMVKPLDVVGPAP
jgi:ribosomal protein S18 acetylase RimI-like enzyme